VDDGVFLDFCLIIWVVFWSWTCANMKSEREGRAMIYSIYGDSEADGEDCNPPFSQSEAYRDLACAAAV